MITIHSTEYRAMDNINPIGSYTGLPPFPNSPGPQGPFPEFLQLPGSSDIYDSSAPFSPALFSIPNQSDNFLQQIFALIWQSLSDITTGAGSGSFGFGGGGFSSGPADPSRIIDPDGSGDGDGMPNSTFQPPKVLTSTGGNSDPGPSKVLTSTGGHFDPGPNGALGKWTDGINAAAYVTGTDPNLIAGQMWAESRGNPNEPSRNADGTTDLGLMQISQERWKRDIVPHLTAEERAKIKEVTGKEPEQLDMHNPNENIIGGSLELAHWIREKGGAEEGLRYYVSGGDPGIGSPTYVRDVLHFRDILAHGGKLPD